MNAPAMVAEHLDERTDALIASWRSTLRGSGDVPRSDSLTHREFIDHVPALIERMAERLRGGDPDVAAEAEKHGRERWAQGYDVAEVVAELGHLRTALTRATFGFARENDFDLSAVEAALATIHDVLNEAETESVRQFREEADEQRRRRDVDVERHGRAAQRAMSEADAERGKLRDLLESLPVGVWVAGADGAIVDLNREAAALQQRTAEECIGRVNVLAESPIYRFSRPDGTEYRPEELPVSRALNGEVVEGEEMRWNQGDGERVVLANAAPLRGAGGTPIGAVVVAQDITARNRLAAELVRTSSQLKGIIEQSPVMIWRTDAQGSNDFVNRPFLDFVGLSFDEAIGREWVRVIHPDDSARVVAEFDTALRVRSIFSGDFRVRRRDGAYRWISSRGVPYTDERGEFLGYLGTVHDITDQHDLEAALQKQKSIAEESSQHKSRLMSALSHDARTPLNAVVLSAQLLEMHVQDDGDPEVAECLRTIRHGVRNVLDLLGDLLDLTRIDAGAMPIEPTYFRLVEALSECFSSIETPARLKGLDCRFTSGGLEGLTVESDRSKLKQILANFLSNALRYTDRGRIRLRGERTAAEVRITVEDTGLGIAAADQAKIFDEFATLESPRRPGGGGTGLGLAICRRLANLLGGEIHLETEPGRGSAFTLALPASIVRAGADDPAPLAAQDRSGEAGPILVAEDHPDSRRTLGRLLRRMGYRVSEAADGREALDLAARERPSLVLMDINMPGMDGVDATLALRADPLLGDLTIFALTGDVSVENQRRIGEAGVQGYLEKPVTAEALRKVLAAIVVPAKVGAATRPLAD